MDSAPSLETVLQALHTLYHGDDGGGKEKASVWLGELQKSVYAWQISDQLLQLNQDMESCYFAAQTMRTKIQYAFHELPPTSHQSLRDSLLSHCTKINHETPHAITIQLCLALSDLALQMASWKNATEELIRQFGSNVQYWTFLLELLALLPEEINSRSLRLGENRRDEVTNELVVASPVLIELLLTVLKTATEDTRIQAQVVHCLGSWLSAYAIPQTFLVPSKLLCIPFSAMSTKDCPSHLHQVASDCICSALYACGDLNVGNELAHALFEGVIALCDGYHMSVALEELDKSVNYARVFTEMGEALVGTIVATPNEGFGSFKTLELLLTCVGHCNFEVADITFTFWNRLAELLYDERDKTVSELFKPYVARLIIALCRHCQYDATMESLPDEADDFDEFRTRSAELIRDSVFIVGASDTFCQMYMTLKGEGSTASWEVSEAALFVMTAVAKDIDPTESVVVPQVLDAVVHLPPAVHVAVRHTSLRLIGELKEWIEKHPNYIEPVLQFLYSGLQQPALATAAAESLQSVCSQCPEQMTNHFNSLLQIVTAIDTLEVNNVAVVGLLKGAAHILGKMDNDKISEGLLQLCNIQAVPLSKLLEAPDGVKMVTGNKHSDPTIWLDRLATIFRYTTPTVNGTSPHPCQNVIQQLWPLLSQSFVKYGADVRIIERCCRCVRFVIRCLGKSSIGLLEPVVSLIVSLYKIHPHSCCLYLGSILVDEYGKESACVPLLVGMLQALCEPTFKVLEEPNGLKNHPDTVDDLFRLVFRFVQKCPLALVQSAVIKPLLACGIAGCALDHKEANISVTKFLAEFIKTGREKEGKEVGEERQIVYQLVEENGQTLVTGLMTACLFCLPTYMIPESADVLYELMRLNRQLVCVWLEVALNGLPTQTAGGAITATHAQLVEFHKSVTAADNMKQVSRSMREFARLYR